MANREEMQKLAYEIEYYRQQGEGIQQRFSQVQTLMVEGEACRKALESLNSNETLMPVGSGFFTKIKIVDSQKVLVDVGGRVMVEKNVSEAKKILDERQADLQKALDELNNAMEKLAGRMAELDAQALKLQG
jgi:prefoldin alpha subunit